MIVYIQFQSQSLLCIKRFMLKAMRLYVKTETSAKQKDSCESRNVRRVCLLIYSLKKKVSKQKQDRKHFYATDTSAVNKQTSFSSRKILFCENTYFTFSHLRLVIS